MGALARVFEAAGLATVGISLVRTSAVAIKAPRFLHCQFPLGRPLGKPGDPEFQSEVLKAAFALLQRDDVPVLEDFGEEIEDDTGQAAACAIPPRLDPTLHPAVDEALGLRPAYKRQLEASSGRTAVGRYVSEEGVPDAIAKLIEIADGASLDETDLDGDQIRALCQDVRAYYEEAGVALSEHVPGARQVETWFFKQTAAGQLTLAAATQLEESGVERAIWHYMRPLTQA